MTDKDFTFRSGPDLLQPKVAVKAKIPPKPAGLTKVANKVWEELGPKLVEVGLLTEVDGAAFTLLCRNISDYEAVLEKLQAVDSFVDETPNKYKVQSVWFTLRNRLHDDILRLCKEFGLTPAARSGMRGAQTGDNQQLGLQLDGNQPAKPEGAYTNFSVRRKS
ncbi:P27 family phage terminase small subunit [Acinetobacter baumannii]|nr:P27 family phage terminase small subunit [Acinetobacter baumannii]EJB8474885.1 P27 family phage terminase small subunit [Acinetobacter baumannii]EJB8549519.1 P27 family phage terminase small subunit [Acinetobacter baumannii]EJB8566671.1 P27 family phage terminase small subunit [Acinetobacter baumannii]